MNHEIVLPHTKSRVDAGDISTLTEDSTGNVDRNCPVCSGKSVGDKAVPRNASIVYRVHRVRSEGTIESELLVVRGVGDAPLDLLSGDILS